MLSCCWFAIITPKTLASVSCRGTPPPAPNQPLAEGVAARRAGCGLGRAVTTRRGNSGPCPALRATDASYAFSPHKNLSIPFPKITSNAQQLAAPSCAAQAHLCSRDLELLRARDAVCQHAHARVSLAQKRRVAAHHTDAGLLCLSISPCGCSPRTPLQAQLGHPHTTQPGSKF